MIVVVLNDGETYTNVEGCRILFVPDSADPDTYVKTMASTGVEVTSVLPDCYKILHEEG